MTSVVDPLFADAHNGSASAVLLAPTATPDSALKAVPSYGSVNLAIPQDDNPGILSTGSVNLASPEESTQHVQHQQALVALALSGAALAALRASRSTKLAQVSDNPTMYGGRHVSQLNNKTQWADVDLGLGRPLGWWAARGGYVRSLVIRATAESIGELLPTWLSGLARQGVTAGLKALTTPGGLRSTQAKELADSSMLVSDAWARNYATKLGAGLGEASADGLLVSLSTLSNAGLAERQAWAIMHSVAGLPPGQALSVTQVAQQRLKALVSSRRIMTARDVGYDIAKLALSQRAKRIVANESEVARNFGTQLLLMNAAQRGYLPADAKKVWVTAVDERVCPVCAPMDSVSVGISESFALRAHHGVLSHDVALWVPPAHPGCRCRIVPERFISGGITTRTARFSRDAHHRARLRSRTEDLVYQAAPPWLSEDADDLSKRWVAALHPRTKAGKFAIAAGVALAAGEAADLYHIRQQTKRGYAVSSLVNPRRRYRTQPGATGMAQGTVITQQTHPEGTYLVSSASLRDYRFPPASRPAGYLDTLRDNMQRKGFTHPIQMRIYSGDTRRAAEIWDGHHRMMLADELGFANIPVHVVHIAQPTPLPKNLLQVYRIINQRQYGYRLSRKHADRTTQGV